MLLDFNPFAEVTDGLMFEWSELRNMESRVDDDNSASNCMPDLQVCIIIQGGLEVKLMHALMFEWSELRSMESRVDNDNSASNCMSDLQVCIIIQGVGS